VKLIAQIPKGQRRFVIEHDKSVGYYLYVFEDERCVYDYLQDTLEIAREQASRQFNVPKDAWTPAD
jgi:hypothetical protein